MRYYAQYNDSGKLLAIGTGSGGTEITESEYNALLSEIREKAAMVDKLYSGEITIDAVPAPWQRRYSAALTNASPPRARQRSRTFPQMKLWRSF